MITVQDEIKKSRCNKIAKTAYKNIIPYATIKKIKKVAHKHQLSPNDLITLIEEIHKRDYVDIRELKHLLKAVEIKKILGKHFSLKFFEIIPASLVPIIEYKRLLEIRAANPNINIKKDIFLAYMVIEKQREDILSVEYMSSLFPIIRKIESIHERKLITYKEFITKLKKMKIENQKRLEDINKQLTTLSETTNNLKLFIDGKIKYDLQKIHEYIDRYSNLILKTKICMNSLPINNEAKKILSFLRKLEEIKNIYIQYHEYTTNTQKYVNKVEQKKNILIKKREELKKEEKILKSIIENNSFLFQNSYQIVSKN